jgi:hypothetical protein
VTIKTVLLVLPGCAIAFPRDLNSSPGYTRTFLYISRVLDGSSPFSVLGILAILCLTCKCVVSLLTVSKVR